MNVADRRAARAETWAGWWKAPICWSGIATDLGGRAQHFERIGDMDRAREFARLRNAADTETAAEYRAIAGR